MYFIAITRLSHKPSWAAAFLQVIFKLLIDRSIDCKLGMGLRVQHSHAQMRGETQLYNTFVMQLVQMRGETSTIFICYATCADDVELADEE